METKIPLVVNLEDWEQSGEGWNAVTYYHKTDENLLLKLNSESMPFEQTLTEEGVEFVEVDQSLFANAMTEGVLKVLTDSQKALYDKILAANPAA